MIFLEVFNEQFNKATTKQLEEYGYKDPEIVVKMNINIEGQNVDIQNNVSNVTYHKGIIIIDTTEPYYRN